jgi:hypothetical protein
MLQPQLYFQQENPTSALPEQKSTALQTRHYTDPIFSRASVLM